jgi:hypothetical protein
LGWMCRPCVMPIYDLRFWVLLDLEEWTTWEPLLSAPSLIYG